MKVYCSGKYKPKYGTDASAGLDLSNNGGKVVIQPNTTKSIDSKVHVAISKGYVGLLFLRSSLGSKNLRLVNSVGVIDSDYRGEIGLKVMNLGHDDVIIEEGERFAQLVVVPYQGGMDLVDSLKDLGETDRGNGGFGSTGKFWKR